MVLFILFPGLGSSHKFWDNDLLEKENKKDTYYIKENDFIKKLKKIGKVYMYTPKAYQIGYYNSEGNQSWNKIYIDSYKKPTKITLDDIDIDKECKRIYNIVKDRDETFIPIGHSKGSWFALHFSNLYPSRCLKMIFLDGSYIVPKLDDKYKKQEKAFDQKDITNENLSLLLKELEKNIKKNRYENNEKAVKIIDKMFEFYRIPYYKIMKKELNGKVKIPLISFVNLKYDINTDNNSNQFNESNMNRVIEDDELFKINGNKIKTHFLINSTHFPWKVDRYNDLIINEIRKLSD